VTSSSSISKNIRSLLRQTPPSIFFYPDVHSNHLPPDSSFHDSPSAYSRKFNDFTAAIAKVMWNVVVISDDPSRRSVLSSRGVTAMSLLDAIQSVPAIPPHALDLLHAASQLYTTALSAKDLYPPPLAPEELQRGIDEGRYKLGRIRFDAKQLRAVVRLTDPLKGHNSIFISPQKYNRANHEDLVAVELLPNPQEGDLWGQVVAVVARGGGAFVAAVEEVRGGRRCELVCRALDGRRGRVLVSSKLVQGGGALRHRMNKKILFSPPPRREKSYGGIASS
jgi:hypothetical protein